ncbi:MAG: ribosomal protein S18-alanine N-acetyltransferase [Lactobacillales bacterium]|jgi:ribosomal-protein-alanine N-acetyltransferase|nr:ribosomal protein S18-alanine N-acetyltransferase [Lactobacillales bacterium]
MLLENSQGFIEFNRVLDEVEIYQVETKPEFRRQGVANGLLAHLLKENEDAKIFLEVRVTNEPARKLYEKFGFKEINTRKNYYKNPTEDAIIYEK